LRRLGKLVASIQTTIKLKLNILEKTFYIKMSVRTLPCNDDHES